MFVGIYAHRYGFIPEGGTVSITEYELRQAIEAKLPSFLYLIAENHRWLPEHIDRGRAGGLLAALKEELEKVISSTSGARYDGDARCLSTTDRKGHQEADY